jgi:hypothetical protein
MSQEEEQEELEDVGDRPPAGEPAAQPGAAAAAQTNAWQCLLSIVAPHVFLKYPSLGVLFRRCDDSLKSLLLDATRRCEVEAFVQGVIRGLGAYPRPFIFFFARPGGIQRSSDVLVVVDDRLRMAIFRDDQKFSLKGRVSYFYKKSPREIQFGFSTRLFMSFTLSKRMIELDALVAGFLENQAQDPFRLFFSCAAEVRARPPGVAGLKEHVFRLIMTPNLEFVRIFQRVQLKPEITERLTHLILTLFAKAHIHPHLFRSIFCSFCASGKTPSDLISGSSFASQLVRAAGHVFHKKLFERKAIQLLKVLSADPVPSSYLRTVLVQVRKMEFHDSFVLLGRILLGTILDGRLDAVDQAIRVLSFYFYGAGLQEALVPQSPEVAARIEMVNRLFNMDASVPEIEKLLPSLKRIIANLIDTLDQPERMSGLSRESGDVAFTNLLIISVMYGKELKEAFAQVDISDEIPAMTALMRQFIQAGENQNNGMGSPPMRVAVDPVKMRMWENRKTGAEKEVE